MARSEFSCNCNIVHHDAVCAACRAKRSDTEYEMLSSFFKVLGDNTRVKILWALVERELCVCDIANLLGMTKSAVSHQLGTLRGANFVKFRRDGKTVYYSLADDHIRTMLNSGLEHVNE